MRVLLERRKKEEEEEEEGECVRERESGKTRGFYRWMEYGCWMVDDDDRLVGWKECVTNVLVGEGVVCVSHGA